MMTRLSIDELKQLPYTHWTEGANLDTTNRGYFIEHAGALWLGQSNAQNTIEEILELAKEQGFRKGFCSITRKTRGTNTRRFSGNMEQLSNAFSVIIWNENVSQRVMRALRKQGIKINKQSNNTRG